MKNSEFVNYFKKGDIIQNFPGSVWKKKKFIIESFYGNSYCPLVSVIEMGMPDSNKYRCNFNARKILLVGASSRPLRKIDKKILVKMMSKGVLEAKREFKIRFNNNCL